jgi:phosphoenolpyruvate synthase/pyruvate phosphate dikinase
MGVVIQRMVSDVKSSAVAFTKDPQEDATDVYIEYTEGLGDRLVAGKVTPRSMVVTREEIGPGRYALGPYVWLMNLARIALRCEAIIGGYADVEAAYNGEWWVCQARRITT